MKNLDYYVQLNMMKSDKNTYLSLIQPDISGGRISKGAIDTIRRYPNITEISISGLTQDTFDYFIENYGYQFKAIMFWKCLLVGELGKIELLDQVEYIVYYWNQRAEKLWDFSKTRSLKGFCFDDFTRMHDISQISNLPSLEELSFGNKDTFITGKRKPFLDSIQDKKRIEKYVKQFSDMYQWYLDNQDASPEDYHQAA